MNGSSPPGGSRPLLTGRYDGPLLAAAGAAALVGLALLPVWLAGGVAARLSGRPWPQQSLRGLMSAAGGLVAHRDTRGWLAPAPPVELTLGLTALFTAALLGLAAVAAVAAYRRGGRAGGLATRSDLMPVLSLPAARSAAATARPSLNRRQRRHAPDGQLGVPLGRHLRSRTPLWAPWTDCHGLVAPTQSGKTLRVAVHQLLAAPGFALVTSTKPDLLLLTAAARMRAGHPVWLLDPTGVGPTWPYPVRWSPVAGCADLAAAERRADALVAAGPSAARGSSGSDGFFAAQARSVLAGYLAAAALTAEHSDGQVATLLGWVADPTDDTAARILRQAGLRIQAGRLAAAAGLVPETRDGIYATIANAVGCLSRPDVLTAVTPAAGDAFDVQAAVRAGGTVFVLGSDTAAGSTAPLITAFVEEVLQTARTLALHTPGERLDPPALALLDEVANIAPVPHLPETISDSAGRGVVISYVLQSLGQARARWGPDRAAVLLDNSTSLLVLGGGKNDRDLAALARLGGQRYRPRMSSNPLEWRVKKLEDDLADALDRLDHHDTTLTADGSLVPAHPCQDQPAAADRGRAWSLWGVPAADRPRHVGWLAEWVDWLNDVYAAYPGHRIPPCWQQHPGLTAELLTLHHTWRAAFLDGRSPEAAQQWHDYQLPGLFGRLPRYLHPHCLAGQHADPAVTDPAWSTWGADPDSHAAQTPQLHGWIGWLNDTYGTATTRRVPQCWPQHPGLAAELLTLYYGWRAAFPEGTSLDSAQAWHSTDLPGLHARLPGYLHPRCLHGEHHEPLPGVPGWSLWQADDPDRHIDAAGLRPWVAWLNETYGTAAAGAHIPACWAHHPGLAAELLTLHYTWQAAFPDGASPDAAQAWHDRALPGLRSRVGSYVHRDCLTGQHQPHHHAPR